MKTWKIWALSSADIEHATERLGWGMAKDLDVFFSTIPKDNRYHIELRTESYLSNPVFDVLEKHGVGQVLFHCTWLPPLCGKAARW